MTYHAVMLRFSLVEVPTGGRCAIFREFLGRGPLTHDPQLDVEIGLPPVIAMTRGFNSPHIADSSHFPSRENEEACHAA